MVLMWTMEHLILHDRVGTPSHVPLSFFFLLPFFIRTLDLVPTCAKYFLNELKHPETSLSTFVIRLSVQHRGRLSSITPITETMPHPTQMFRIKDLTLMYQSATDATESHPRNG